MFNYGLKIIGPPALFSTEDLEAYKVFKLPQINPSSVATTGGLGYYPPTGTFYSGDSGVWSPIATGSMFISNAIDDNPIPNPQYLIDAQSKVRNIKTRGNGLVTTTTGNSVVVDYIPLYTTDTPNPYPILKPVSNTGVFSSVYSSDDSIAISQDINQNYNIKANTSVLLQNANNTQPDPQEVLVNTLGKVKRVKASTGLNLLLPSPDDNYVFLRAYDYINDVNVPTIGPFTNTIFSYTVPVNTSLYFKILIKGTNVTDGKQYFYDYDISAKNFAGVTISSPVLNSFSDGDIISMTPSVSGSNIIITATSVTNKNTVWAVRAFIN